MEGLCLCGACVHHGCCLIGTDQAAALAQPGAALACATAARTRATYERPSAYTTRALRVHGEKVVTAHHAQSRKAGTEAATQDGNDDPTGLTRDHALAKLRRRAGRTICPRLSGGDACGGGETAHDRVGGTVGEGSAAAIADAAVADFRRAVYHYTYGQYYFSGAA